MVYGIEKKQEHPWRWLTLETHSKLGKSLLGLMCFLPWDSSAKSWPLQHFFVKKHCSTPKFELLFLGPPGNTWMWNTVSIYSSTKTVSIKHCFYFYLLFFFRSTWMFYSNQLSPKSSNFLRCQGVPPFFCPVNFNPSNLASASFGASSASTSRPCEVNISSLGAANERDLKEKQQCIYQRNKLYSSL